MKLNLVVLRAPEPIALVRFYEALGLRFIAERHGGGAEHHSCTDGGVTLEIYPASGDDTTVRTRIGFAVDDLQQACAVARRFGRVVKEPSQTPWGLRAVIVDPAGHKVELTSHDEERDRCMAADVSPP